MKRHRVGVEHAGRAGVPRPYKLIVLRTKRKQLRYNLYDRSAGVPQKAVAAILQQSLGAPGQAAVFYSGDVLVGGGVVTAYTQCEIALEAHRQGGRPLWQ